MMITTLQINQKTGDFQLKNGDLLFQDLDCGPLCRAIEKVTFGYKNANLSHVGIVHIDPGGKTWVIEAYSEEVSKTPLDEFLNRSHDENGNPKVIAGRVKKAFQPIVDTAVANALDLIGKPYDPTYELENKAYYCSELVYAVFYLAYNHNPLFELKPMTFINPATEEVYPAWKTHFKALDIPVPEGKPGINPGSLSRSVNIEIIHAYGIPSGWRNNVLKRQ